MCPKNGGQYNLEYVRNRYGVFVGYSWGVHGVFVGYTYVSGMCRVCIGNVSGIHRKKQDAKQNAKRCRKITKYSKTFGNVSKI